MSERIVLGGLMLDNQKMHDVLPLLTPESFTDFNLGKLYRHLMQFHHDQKPFDVISIGATLGNSWIGPCGDMVTRSAKHGNILHHAGIVRNLHHRKNIQNMLTNVLGKLAKGGENQVAIDEINMFLSSFDNASESLLRNIADSLPDLLDKLNERAESGDEIIGLTTGIPDLDRATQGIQDADLVVIGGRPSSGKTALGLNIAAHNAFECNKTVLVFSVEMPEMKIQQRLLTSLSQVNYKSIQTATCMSSDKSFCALGESIGKIKQGKFIINDSSTLSTQQMKSESIRYKRKYGKVDLIVVDYIQLLSTKAESRFQEVSKISRDLKAIAKLLDCPVIAISQLNRSLESRENKRPVMADLRESGQLEQDADIVVFIYRDEVYDEFSPAQGLAEIIIAKGRDCGLSNIVSKWSGDTQTFSSASPYDYDTIQKLKLSVKENSFGGSDFQDKYKKGFKGKGVR